MKPDQSALDGRYLMTIAYLDPLSRNIVQNVLAPDFNDLAAGNDVGHAAETDSVEWDDQAEKISQSSERSNQADEELIRKFADNVANPR